MSESTLSLSYLELKRRVARYLGYDTDDTQWSTEQSNEIADVILSGLRQFYYPPIAYDWRFLKPNATLNVTSAAEDYDLPDDFGSLCGSYLTFPSETQMLYVEVTGEYRIRINRQSGLTSGRPQLAAVVPKIVSSPGQAGQRFQIMFWPKPDKNYTLAYQYEVIPYSLTDNRIYPYGGAVHAETILQSCLAAAELHIEREHGAQHERFMERLKASIKKDQQLSPRILRAPTYEDFEYDRSDYRGSYIATVNGLDPS